MMVMIPTAGTNKQTDKQTKRLVGNHTKLTISLLQTVENVASNGSQNRMKTECLLHLLCLPFVEFITLIISYLV